MPRAGNYDLAFRPPYWWGALDLETHYSSRIKGELRRRSAPADAAAGLGSPLMLEPSLPPEVRDQLGSIHPWMIGGEYLPDFLPTEIEIARAVLKSTTMDVISFRARRTKNRILYRIVDEYPGDDLPHPLSQASSYRPLTFRQLTKMIETSGVFDARAANCGADGAPEEYYDFVTIHSQIYPDLERWFGDTGEEWLDEQLALHAEKNSAPVAVARATERQLFGKMARVTRYPMDRDLPETPEPVTNRPPPVYDLVGSVMRKYGFTLEEALQAIEDFGG